MHVFLATFADFIFHKKVIVQMYLYKYNMLQSRINGQEGMKKTILTIMMMLLTACAGTSAKEPSKSEPVSPTLAGTLPTTCQDFSIPDIAATSKKSVRIGQPDFSFMQYPVKILSEFRNHADVDRNKIVLFNEMAPDCRLNCAFVRDGIENQMDVRLNNSFARTGGGLRTWA